MELYGKAIWITWHHHQRTESLVARFGVDHFVCNYGGGFKRHFGGFFWTLRTLAHERPDIVFLHFSYILQLAVLIYKYLFRLGRVAVVSDCHNKALKREMSGVMRRPFLVFKSLLFRRVDLIIVTNEALVPYARKFCSAVAVIRDPLTDWSTHNYNPHSIQDDSGGHVFFVCSFDKDEPAELVFAAAESVVRDLKMRVVISGRVPAGIAPDRVRKSEDIQLPGYMPGSEYREKLMTAAVVVVLTKDQDCLVCGAYESLGAGRPTVLSATNSLRNCFGNMATYASHSPEAIVAAIQTALARGEISLDLRQRFEAAWQSEWDDLKLAVAKAAGS